MFNYYDLNTSANLGFFKHSNDDYNFVNRNRLASDNPYIGYFSQFKNVGLLGLLPKYNSDIIPYKKGNPLIITREIINPLKNDNFSSFQKDLSSNPINISNFISLNHLLFGNKIFEPDNNFYISDSNTVIIESDSESNPSVEINSSSTEELLNFNPIIETENFNLPQDNKLIESSILNEEMTIPNYSLLYDETTTKEDDTPDYSLLYDETTVEEDNIPDYSLLYDETTTKEDNTPDYSLLYDETNNKEDNIPDYSLLYDETIAEENNSTEAIVSEESTDSTEEDYVFV